ncbi:MAG TPA: thioredoxin family protein [Gryllotalpicola sp.]
MSPLAAVLVVTALVAVATTVGLLWRRGNGRVRASAPQASESLTPADVGSSAAFGSRATLLQFSTEYCAYCPATRRLLGSVAERTAGVVHIDVDLTDSPELARRFRILQTPTTFLLDGAGAVRGRIGGAPRPAELEASLAAILSPS